MLYYYFILAFQGYCIYHAYKNKNNYYWFFIIFFIPLLGCLIYLFTQVINKKDIDIISNEISTIINPTKKIKDLEKVLQFSNTFQNKINLAEAHSENNDFDNAILHYEEALKSNFKEDPYTLNNLLYCYFKVEKFNQVIEIAKKINIDKDFKQSAFYFGLSLEKKGKIEEAERELRKMDNRYSNYNERLEISKFFIRNSKRKEAETILNEIQSEINSMTKQNSKKYRYLLLEAEKLISLKIK